MFPPTFATTYQPGRNLETNFRPVYIDMSQPSPAQELRADRQPEFTQIEAWAQDLKIEGSAHPK